MAAVFVVLPSSVLAADQEGYLPNGSMTAGKELPDGWHAGATEGSGTASAAKDAQVFKEGPASLRLSVTGGARGSVTCPLPTVAGKEVAVTGWVRAEGQLTAGVLVFICPGADPAWHPIRPISAGSTWRRVHAKVKLPAGGETPFLMLQIEGEGSAWLDEVAILPADRFQAEPLISEFDAVPLFSFLAWEKKPRSEDGALCIQAPTGQGGAGYELRTDLSPFADRTPALTVTIGARNQAKAMTVALKDADGTAHEYSFKLEGVAAGVTTTVIANDGASLQVPGSLGDSGKQAGFDPAHVAQLILLGNWSAVPVDVTVRRLELVEPTPAILAARERLRQRLAKEAEGRRQAEEARARRKRELLAGAPHPADGPDVRHVALVAPDILVVQIQEKDFVPVPQVPYEAREGDTVKRSGDQEQKVIVVEEGRVQESLLEVGVVRKEGGQEVKLGHLAVNAGRIKPEDQATGQDLTSDTIDEPAAYRIASDDDPAWKAPAVPVQVWWKRKPNAHRSLAFQADVFLKLPRPLAEGKSYRIEFPGVNLRQAFVTYRHGPSKCRSPAVHVSAIGFRPDDPFKRALLSTWLGTGGACHFGQAPRFHLLDDATGQAVFDGTVQALKGADDAETFKAGRNYCKTDVLAADFSEFRAPGRYRVYVEGLGCSYPFTIAEDVWLQAFRLSMQGLLHQRSGIDLGPPFTDYVRPRNMHPADGVKVFASAGSELETGSQDGAFQMLMQRRTDRLLSDAWGGHMDAGDWDRNTQHPAAMWILLDLYELFPAQNRPAAKRIRLVRRRTSILWGPSCTRC
jgi:endoglucanase